MAAKDKEMQKIVAEQRKELAAKTEQNKKSLIGHKENFQQKTAQMQGAHALVGTAATEERCEVETQV